MAIYDVCEKMALHEFTSLWAAACGELSLRDMHSSQQTKELEVSAQRGLQVG